MSILVNRRTIRRDFISGYASVDEVIVVHTNSTINTNEENSETRKMCVGMDYILIKKMINNRFYK